MHTRGNDDETNEITYALSVLWNFTAELKSLVMLFLTVFEVLFVVGVPLGAERTNNRLSRELKWNFSRFENYKLNFGTLAVPFPPLYAT